MTRPTAAELPAIADAIGHMFGRHGVPAGVMYGTWEPDQILIDVCRDSDTPIAFKFEHMPALAALLRTEKLDFEAWWGDRIIDSVTFDGCVVLRIWARYV